MDRPRVLDTVELTREVSGVPAGTIGAIVTEYPASALVEIVGIPEGDLLDDLISVPYEAVRVVERSSAPEVLHQ